MTTISTKTLTHLDHPTKRRKTSSHSSPSSPDWSGLHTDLLESILNRLSGVDLLRARRVCHSWCSLAEALISSLQSPLFDQPLLILPTHDEANKNSRCSYNLTQKKVYKQLMNIPQDLNHSGNCIGSSHGWLIFLNRKAIPYIFSPFLNVWVQLPLFRVTGEVCKNFIDPLLVQNIVKAVLSSDPIHSDNNYCVVVIYGYDSKLAFWRCGDTDWTALNGAHQPYCDIISYKDHIIALGKRGSVEIWDFNNSIPVKKKDIQPSFPNEKVKFDKSLYSSRCYLVESVGDLLYIVRYIGNFVRWDGIAIHEADLLDEENQCYYCCPYLTKLFHVYKLDFNQEKWVEVGSLGDDCVLFLGRNHSVSLSAKSFPICKGNSIYFTDEFWDRMDEHDMYGGHDTGRFDLGDQNIELINEDEGELQKIEPPPIWIVPNPW